ncbi:FimV/HubP family polar landmark protein [Microbulbifer taiwanensis]|uniref:FimV/HubP family polar landmark protein n=1 Tax=Microbulbifer taiwanensis TaxID=986746 RepID=UPI003671EED5
MNFLVETRWPSGRLLREYTLLMDLPAFSTSTAQQPVRAAERERQQVRRDAPVQRPVQRPAEPASAVESQPAAAEAQEQQRAPQAVEESVQFSRESRPAAAASDTASGSQVYGPVSASDTLWEIALKNRVGREYSVQQTMLAIQRLNPEAFIDNNINLLKKGTVLRLPNAEDIRTLSLRDAISEVAVQNDSWRQRIGDDVTTEAPLDARAVADDSAAGETVEGRVSLAAPGDNESVMSGSGSGAEDSEALSGELAVTEEELDKSRLENEELQERISELDEQIDTMERLVEVSNEEMRAVQDAAAQSEPSANPVAVGESAEVAEEAAAEEPAAEVAEEPAAAQEPGAAEEDRRNRVVAVQTQAEPSLVDQLMENIQLIAIGAGALLVGLFGFFTWRRRKEEEEAMLQVEREMAAERALAEAPEVGEPDEDLAALESMEADEGFDLGQLDDVGTDDPISEAEIHLSLGQYDEAEGKLLQGLQQDGQNVDARLMLLEVYAHQQSADKFDDHYRQLLSVSDGPAADRAARLRESISGAPPFEAPAMDFTSESLEATQLDDISASFEDDFSSEMPSSEIESDSGFGDEFDSDTSLLDDLTMDLSDDSGSAASASDDDFSLDLDLDSDFDSGAAAEQGATQDSGHENANESAEEEFNLDDLMSGDLDLGDLDLGSDDGLGEGDETKGDLGPIEYEAPQLADAEADNAEAGSVELESAELSGVEVENTGSESLEESGGLEFDLDLSPVEGEGELRLDSEEVAATAEPESGDDTLELSLDDISDDELDSFGGELDGGLDLDSIDLDDIAGGLSSEEELSLDTDVAVAEKAEQATRQVAVEADQPAAGQQGEAEFGDLGFNLESDLDSELNLLEGSDEVSTKLELAQAYLDMGDKDGAKDILNEVVQEGAGEHKARAEEMLERI